MGAYTIVFLRCLKAARKIIADKLGVPIDDVDLEEV
jgi:hypothetical protein